MEEKPAGWQRVAKMKELGIYDKWVTNTDALTQESYERCYTQDIIDSEKIKRRNRKVKEEWAHACIDGDKVKVKKGPSGLQLVEMSVLEARLLANEILSITNKQRRKRK